MIVTSRLQSDPALLKRLDPAYWDPAYSRLLDGCRHPLVPLGDYIEHITYGPIVTGRKPPPPPAAGPAVAIINQGQLLFSGVDITDALVVPAGCPWDAPRARLQYNDLVLARSGAGSLGKNRICVFCEDFPAVVGSFVDLVRLRDLDPFYVATFFKTQFGWGQIFRIINGVGPPNISFGEIADLLVPLAPARIQWRVRHRYHLHVLPLHRAAVGLKLEAIARGMPPAAAADQPLVSLGLQQATDTFRALIADLEAYLAGKRDDI